MNGYVTPARYSRVIDLPISFAQTELRRGKFIHIAQMPVTRGQLLQLRSLMVHVVKNLTPGLLPTFSTTSLGIISLGLYYGSALTSPLALASLYNLGVSSINPFAVVKCASPGVYTIVVANNTTNMDFAVSATGTAKLYL